MKSPYAIAQKGTTDITSCRRSCVSYKPADRITSTKAVCREAVKLPLPNGSRHPKAMSLSQQSRDKEESFKPCFNLRGASTESSSASNALRSDRHNREEQLLY